MTSLSLQICVFRTIHINGIIKSCFVCVTVSDFLCLAKYFQCSSILYHESVFQSFFKFNLILFSERREGKEKGRETSVCVFSPAHPILGTWPITQACALPGNRTGYPLVCRAALNPRSHTSLGNISVIFIIK